MHLALPLRKVEDLARTLTSATDGDLKDLAATRRGLILAPLLAALPTIIFTDPARRSIRRKPKSHYLININGSPD